MARFGGSLFLILLVTSLSVPLATAQEEPAPPEEAQQEAGVVERFLAEQEKAEEAEDESAEGTSADPRIPQVTPQVFEDESTRKAYFQALQAHYRYRTEGFEHRMRVFRWQLLSERLIFCVVILLVLIGVVFSGVQFRIGLQAAKAGKDLPNTQLKLSGKGVEVSSSILGVILLVISLAFFYLYLVHVYPIEEIF